MSLRVRFVTVLIIIVLVSLGCNLPSIARSGGGEISTPQGQGQQNTNQPERPAAGGKREPVQAGLGARAAYELAVEKAREWSDNAILERINSTQINLQGESAYWVLLFADDSLISAQDRSQGYIVMVDSSGVIDARPDSIFLNDGLLQADIANWQVDSVQAVTACEQAGGASLRAAYPDVTVDAQFQAYDYSEWQGFAQHSTENLIWFINYNLPDIGSALICEIDGANGQVFGLKTFVEDPSAQAVPAFAPFKLALEKALQWNAGAALYSVTAENPGSAPDIFVDGATRYWLYTFVVLPEPDGADYQPAYTVIASSQGLTGFGADSTYARSAANGLQADWLIDSTEAYQIAEDNGGKAFRDQYPKARLDMACYFAFTPVEKDLFPTTKNIRWKVEYSIEGDYDHALTVEIDAASGTVIGQ